MWRLSEERVQVGRIVERERYALDAMVKREREALTEEAHTLVDEGIKNTMEELRRTIRTIALLALLFIIVILGLTFYAGYLLGKKRVINLPNLDYKILYCSLK